MVLKFTSQNEPARGLTTSTRSQQLVRRKAFSHVHACDDQKIDAVPDAVLVLALPTNESETSQSQRRTRKGRFACFSTVDSISYVRNFEQLPTQARLR